MIPSTQDNLDIFLISQLLPISHFTLSPEKELTSAPCPAKIESFFTNKHNEYAPPGIKSTFHIFGANASPNGTVLNVFYEYGPFLTDNVDKASFRMTVRSIDA